MHIVYRDRFLCRAIAAKFSGATVSLRKIMRAGALVIEVSRRVTVAGLWFQPSNQVEGYGLGPGRHVLDCPDSRTSGRCATSPSGKTGGSREPSRPGEKPRHKALPRAPYLDCAASVKRRLRAGALRSYGEAYAARLAW